MKEGDFVDVEWLDAVDAKLDTETIKLLDEFTDGRELLAVNNTYGKLYKILKEVVLVLTEESTASESEITVIPRNWIVSPKRLAK